ncbi:MAG: hypothetical protein AAF628_11430 [Planctomycetota bacterium]
MVTRLWRPSLAAVGLVGSLVLSSCSRRDAGPPTLVPANVLAVHHGRLVDLYGLAGSGDQIALHQRDVLIGYALPSSGDLEWLGTHPDSLQPRLLVRHQLESAEFDAALATLRAGTVRVDVGAEPELPADAAFELRLREPIAFGEQLFVGRSSLLAPSVLQLRTGAGDDEQLVPVRAVSRGDVLVLDPVLLAAEVRVLELEPALGLPVGDPARLAVPSQSPLAPAEVGEGGPNHVVPRQTARTLVQFNAVAPAPEVVAPQLLGQLPLVLERVDDAGPDALLLTLFKAGLVHDIDRSDVLSFADATGSDLSTEIVADPVADRGRAEVQHVQVLVRRVPGLVELDPQRLAGYPADPESAAGEAWLRENAPAATLRAPFTKERMGAASGDDPALFVRFDPPPVGGGPPNENVSPFASAILTFSRPIRPVTARPLDTLFFGTRDLLDPTEEQQFIAERGIDPASFSPAKYRTPHLVASRLFDELGGFTTLRLQPPLGFYLDDAMRQADEGQPFAQKSFRYFLHLKAGDEGITGVDGWPLDLGADAAGPSFAVVPFSLDTRSSAGSPLFPDNLAVSVARRFGAEDEDEQPSYYLADEVQAAGAPVNPLAFPLQDFFGSAVVVASSGALRGLPPVRVRRVVDDVNQPAPPPQSTPQRFCPQAIGAAGQVASGTAAERFGAALQNPLNPHGARLQTVWREIDMGLSRTDPTDFNLEVEQMYMGAFSGAPITPDRFDRVSLFLGHSEHRPEACVGSFSALASMPDSGLRAEFEENYVANLDTSGAVESRPAAHPAFVDQAWTIDPTAAVLDPTGTYRYLPLPDFQEPYFVWRDERAMEQGGQARLGNDVDKSAPLNFESYVLSPFLGGQGRLVTSGPAGVQVNLGAWNNQREHSLTAASQPEPLTQGSIGAIGLPLLADLWVHPRRRSASTACRFPSRSPLGRRPSTGRSPPAARRPRSIRRRRSGRRLPAGSRPPGAGPAPKTTPCIGSWPTSSSAGRS